MKGKIDGYTFNDESLNVRVWDGINCMTCQACIECGLCKCETPNRGKK